VIRAGKVKALVVVASPRTLAELRNAFHPDVKTCMIAEINKDLTKHPVGDIEKHLAAMPGEGSCAGRALAGQPCSFSTQVGMILPPRNRRNSPSKQTDEAPGLIKDQQVGYRAGHPYWRERAR
jgi:hypothetical protein